MDNNYQLIIIGGGPAGLCAGIYASRGGLRTLLIEKAILGGQITNAEIVENYPGFPDGISGFELGQLMGKQAIKHGLNIINAEAKGIALLGKDKIAKTSEGDFLAKAVIIATGSSFNKLGVPGEEEFLGKGVSYCATCDGPLFKDRVVAVVGGGDTAITDALFLTRFSSKVIVIHRRNQLRASKVFQERAFDNPKIEFLWDTVADSIIGDDLVRGLRLRNVKTGESSSLEVAGIFMAVGSHPNTDYLEGLLTLAPGGFIPTNERMETDIPGIFAAGDIRYNSPRQVITAAGDGAIAAFSAERFLSEQR